MGWIRDSRIAKSQVDVAKLAKKKYSAHPRNASKLDFDSLFPLHAKYKQGFGGQGKWQGPYIILTNRKPEVECTALS